MSGVRAGRLKDQVSIQVRSTEKDAFGQQLNTWTTTLTRRCGIEPLNGREFFAAEGENTTVTTRIRFHYERGILSAGHRLVDNRESPQVIYDIQSVIDPGNEHRELICMCEVLS